MGMANQIMDKLAENGFKIDENNKDFIFGLVHHAIRGVAGVAHHAIGAVRGVAHHLLGDKDKQDYYYGYHPYHHYGHHHYYYGDEDKNDVNFPWYIPLIGDEE